MDSSKKSPKRQSESKSQRSEKETDIVSACKDWLGAKHIFYFRINNTGIWDEGKKRFHTFHGTKGVSDIIGILPGGRFFACEVKTEKGVVSDAQEKFLTGVDCAGGLAMIVRSVDDLEQFISEEIGS